MDNFFTNAFNNMDAQSKESFYKTVFMNDDSEYAANLRLEYYKTKFKSMGENVTIGKGVTSNILWHKRVKAHTLTRIAVRSAVQSAAMWL